MRVRVGARVRVRVRFRVRVEVRVTGEEGQCRDDDEAIRLENPLH